MHVDLGIFQRKQDKAKVLYPDAKQRVTSGIEIERTRMSLAPRNRQALYLRGKYERIGRLFTWLITDFIPHALVDFLTAKNSSGSS
jgi:hypothetical protein